MSIAGRTYLERGEPVTVLTQWGPNAGVSAPVGGVDVFDLQLGRRGPRNVRIRRADGSMVVRPFRGLRRCETPPAILPPPVHTPSASNGGS